MINANKFNLNRLLGLVRLFVPLIIIDSGLYNIILAINYSYAFS